MNIPSLTPFDEDEPRYSTERAFISSHRAAIAREHIPSVTSDSDDHVDDDESLSVREQRIVDDDESLADQITCPICLEETPSHEATRAVCGHAFCSGCVGKLREHCERDDVPCPCCKRPLAVVGELNRSSGRPAWAMIREGDVFRNERGRPMAIRASATAAWWNAGRRERPDPEEQRALARAAGRKLVLRYCPGCNTPISKQGGCPQMACPCGERFRWYDARPVRPCAECHVDSDDGLIGRWRTCEYCSNAAKAKCAALKAGTAAAIVPTAAAAIGVGVTAAAAAVVVGATIAVVPAVTIGPFALAYEPVRRLRKKKSNPLAMAAGSGLMVVGSGVVLCAMALGNESD